MQNVLDDQEMHSLNHYDVECVFRMTGQTGSPLYMWVQDA